MTTTTPLLVPAPPVEARATPVRRRHVIPPHWPLIGMFMLYPLWFAGGVANLAWPIIAMPLAFQLLARRNLVASRGFGLWVLFMVWVLLSASQLEKFSHYIAFGWRLSLWVSALLVFLYIVNSSRAVLPIETVLDLLLVLWAACVIGGCLGLVLGQHRLWTPAQALIPDDWADIDFIRETIAPRFAQVQNFLGYPLPRPSAPFTFTNEWGANVAVLVPAVIAAWPRLRGTKRRVVGGLALLSIVPMIVSVNRGLWVTLIGTSVYVAVRLAQRRDPRTARRLAFAGVALLAIIAFTPLGNVVAGRLENDHSNRARLTIYTQVEEAVHDSPLLGFGSPRENDLFPELPPVGTHGTFWYVLFSHGVPGVVLFSAALGALVLATANPVDRHLLWLHGTVFGGAMLIPFYDLLPVPIFTVMAAAAVIVRDGREPAPA